MASSPKMNTNWEICVTLISNQLHNVLDGYVHYIICVDKWEFCAAETLAFVFRSLQWESLIIIGTIWFVNQTLRLSREHVWWCTILWAVMGCNLLLFKSLGYLHFIIHMINRSEQERQTAVKRAQNRMTNRAGNRGSRGLNSMLIRAAERCLVNITGRTIVVIIGSPVPSWFRLVIQGEMILMHSEIWSNPKTSMKGVKVLQTLQCTVLWYMEWLVDTGPYSALLLK